MGWWCVYVYVYVCVCVSGWWGVREGTGWVGGWVGVCGVVWVVVLTVCLDDVSVDITEQSCT